MLVVSGAVMWQTLVVPETRTARQMMARSAEPGRIEQPTPEPSTDGRPAAARSDRRERDAFRADSDDDAAVPGAAGESVAEAPADPGTEPPDVAAETALTDATGAGETAPVEAPPSPGVDPLADADVDTALAATVAPAASAAPPEPEVRIAVATRDNRL